MQGSFCEHGRDPASPRRAAASLSRSIPRERCGRCAGTGSPRGATCVIRLDARSRGPACFTLLPLPTYGCSSEGLPPFLLVTALLPSAVRHWGRRRGVACPAELAGSNNGNRRSENFVTQASHPAQYPALCW